MRRRRGGLPQGAPVLRLTRSRKIPMEIGKAIARDAHKGRSIRGGEAVLAGGCAVFFLTPPGSCVLKVLI